MLRLTRRQKWSSLTGPRDGVAWGAAGTVSVVVICGEHLDAALRDALASTFEVAAPIEPDAGTGTALVVIEELCAHPDRLGTFCREQRPAAVVVVACDLPAARAARDGAVAEGIDPAHVVPLSLAPALGFESIERTRLVTATCRAASLRARALAGQPPARLVPWQAGQSMGRRGLFGAWRGLPSLTAHIDQDACAGAELCGRCRSDCPVGAIIVNGVTPQIDPRACVSCGRCVVTCPTRAISMPGADLDGIIAELGSLLGDGVGEIAVVCEQAVPAERPVPKGVEPGTEAVVSLPCLAVLGNGAALMLTAGGARIHTEACGNCHSHEVVESSTRFTDRLMNILGNEYNQSLPASASSTHLTWSEPDATNAAVALLAGPERLGATLQQILDQGASTSVVRVDGSRCTMCGSCDLACPSTALTLDRGAQTLAVDSSQCVGCGRCVAVCPEAAISVERGIDIGSVLNGPTFLRATGRPEVCQDCGMTIDADPLVASVQRRLAAQGRAPALIDSLRRCPACSGKLSHREQEGVQRGVPGQVEGLSPLLPGVGPA